MKNNQSTNNAPEQNSSSRKAQIYNLIIVDESGSMGCLRTATLKGINETIDTIRTAQRDFGDKQEHFLTLVSFDSGYRKASVRTVIDTMPIDKVENFADYSPCGGTPLYDDIGLSLTALHERIMDNEDATAVVTILSDGMENSSVEWSGPAVKQLIEQLTEEGWSLSYMGSAHDVKDVTINLSINNFIEFSHDDMGTSSTWGREMASKRAYYQKMNNGYCGSDSLEKKRAMRRKFASEYYSQRVTPEPVTALQPNEVFVFGSNPQGRHEGGAAAFALKHFGAQMGVGEGPQGQSYAIPTTGGFDLLRQAVGRFIDFARNNPDKRFLVTAVGCGTAGLDPRKVAMLFVDAVKVENIALPKVLWEYLGLNMQ